MTLRDLERIVYRRLNKSATVPNAETQQRIRGFINERHRMILRKFPKLRDEILTFESAEEVQDYAVPEQGIARINRIWETDNDMALEQRNLSWLRTVDPDPQLGTPEIWVPLSYVQVHTQMAAANSIFVDSTSASDTNRAYVEGITEDGARRRAEVTMTGTTAVDVDSTIPNWISIDKFYLSAPAVGTVTMHEDAGGGEELSFIAPGDTYAKFIAFLLYPTPSSAITYFIDVTRSIDDMVNPLDEPLLPQDFHDLLAIGARLDEYEHSDDARRRLAEVEWDEGMKALTTWMVTHPSARIDLNMDNMGGGRSRLGGWFPAGS